MPAFLTAAAVNAHANACCPTRQPRPSGAAFATAASTGWSRSSTRLPSLPPSSPNWAGRQASARPASISLSAPPSQAAATLSGPLPKVVRVCRPFLMRTWGGRGGRPGGAARTGFGLKVDPNGPGENWWAADDVVELTDRRLAKSTAELRRCAAYMFATEVQAPRTVRHAQSGSRFRGGAGPGQPPSPKMRQPHGAGDRQ